MSVHVILRYLYLFVHSGVQHILCCVFVFFCPRLVSYAPYIAIFSGLSIFIAPLVFSNTYFNYKISVHSYENNIC